MPQNKCDKVQTSDMSVIGIPERKKGDNGQQKHI